MKNTRHIPTYRLYGEESSSALVGSVHCEHIRARSSENNWHIQAHKHAQLLQMLWIKEGGAMVHVDEKDFQMSRGDTISIPPGYIHGFDFLPNTEGYVVTFESRLIDNVVQRLPEYPQCLSQLHWMKNTKNRQALPQLFECIALSFQEGLPNKLGSISLLGEALLMSWVEETQDLIRDESVHRQRSEEHFYKFERLVNLHYKNQKTVAWYANQIGVSPEHLNVITKKITGYSALNTIHQRLLIEAKRLLIFTVLNSEQISQSLGFKDPAYFSRFFKNKTGMAPKEFTQSRE